HKNVARRARGRAIGGILLWAADVAKCVRKFPPYAPIDAQRVFGDFHSRIEIVVGGRVAGINDLLEQRRRHEERTARAAWHPSWKRFAFTMWLHRMSTSILNGMFAVNSIPRPRR